MVDEIVRLRGVWVREGCFSVERRKIYTEREWEREREKKRVGERKKIYDERGRIKKIQWLE